MPDGKLDVAGRLNKFSNTMFVSALSASDRRHVPIMACLAFCWKRTKTTPRHSCSVRRRELAQKTPECRGKQQGCTIRRPNCSISRQSALARGSACAAPLFLFRWSALLRSSRVTRGYELDGLQCRGFPRDSSCMRLESNVALYHGRIGRLPVS